MLTKTSLPGCTDIYIRLDQAKIYSTVAINKTTIPTDHFTVERRPEKMDVYFCHPLFTGTILQ